MNLCFTNQARSVEVFLLKTKNKLKKKTTAVNHLLRERKNDEEKKKKRRKQQGLGGGGWGDIVLIHLMSTYLILFKENQQKAF